MADMERLVRIRITSDKIEVLEAIVAGIANGERTLLDLVKALGEYLTAEDSSLRSRGVDLLAEVLTRCPAENINRHSARVLNLFFCEKLDDIDTQIPALKGLLSLIAIPCFTSSDAFETLRAIFRHVNMKAHVMSTRHLVFKIVDSLMALHRDALKTMGEEFLGNYIKLADGEKDPRNLLLAFSIDRVILIEFNITRYISEMFDILFCYFPITFSPPPNDPYGITTEDLRVALRSCLSATPFFGPLAVPPLIEKIALGSPSIKMDCLQTLTATLPIYGSSLCREYGPKLWQTLKIEVFHPTNPEVAAETLNVMRTLLRTATVSEEFGGLAKTICEECIEILNEPEKSRSQAAIRILCSFIATNALISKATLTQAIPHLISLFLNPEEISARPAILSALTNLLQAVRETFLTADMSRDYEKEQPLHAFKDQILGAFIAGLEPSNNCSSALDGLLQLIRIPKLLSLEELGFIVHNVNGVLLSDADEMEDTRLSTLTLLNGVSEITPKPLEETTLPLLFSCLPDSAPPLGSSKERSKIRGILLALQSLCVQPSLFETLVIRVSTKLDILCSAKNSPLTKDNAVSIYVHSLLTTLGKVLDVKLTAGHLDLPKYIDRLVPSLYHNFIRAALAPPEENAVARDTRLITDAAQIVSLVMLSLPLDRQRTFLSATFSAFQDGNVNLIAKGYEKMPEGARFQPFADGISDTQKNLVQLFSVSIVALRQEVQLPVESPTIFLQGLISWALDQASSTQQRDSALHVVASVLNKHIEDYGSLISDYLPVLWDTEILHQNSPLDRRLIAINAWVWITKALLIRNRPEAMTNVDCLFSLFDDETASWHAAKAIGDVGHGGADVLTKRNFSILRLLYAQKFFNTVVPRIISGYRSSTGSRPQTAYLVCLASLIKNMPKAVYINEVSTLLPLLLRGMELPDVTMRTNVIDALLAVASEKNDILSDHAATLVNAMLKNSRPQEITSPALRIAALRCLAVFPSTVRYDILHPLKPIVLRELGKAIDDPKRAVRKEAVDARDNWFSYNG